MPDTKTIELSLFHSLAYVSVMLQAIHTSKVPTSADQHGQGVNVSHDYHVKKRKRA